ncbi:hypothetical protein J2Z22_003788 [Paenibacillus forsythiae]|uniref:Uncharacterized protein n=1 Tax=Paenibacillus forsythiae TaxID=365616 RepID=A0ABU3HBK3_9BACL|nr:hypothetical protein [Paenibacillus forsythiae]MDT3428197.1 hypothetical protein [Paenibacillus forsythiae]
MSMKLAILGLRRSKLSCRLPKLYNSCEAIYHYDGGIAFENVAT